MMGPDVFWLGFIGGLVVQGLRIVEMERTPADQRPTTFKDPLYWFQFFFWSMVGGGIASLYQNSGNPLTPLLCVNIGASAPLIVKQMISTLPPIGPRNSN